MFVTRNDGTYERVLILVVALFDDNTGHLKYAKDRVKCVAFQVDKNSQGIYIARESPLVSVMCMVCLPV